MFDALKKSRFAFEVYSIPESVSIWTKIKASCMQVVRRFCYLNKIVDAPSIESLSSVIAKKSVIMQLILWKKNSAIAGGGYVYRVIFESNGTEFEAHISPDSLSIVLITKDFGGDFVDNGVC